MRIHTWPYSLIVLYDRLNSADVMNRDLKYIYPISRVQSIEQLLRVTAHNAFFVVTPLSTKDVYEQDSKIEDVMESNFMPQLYNRVSIHPVNPVTAKAMRMKMGGLESERSAVPIRTSSTLPVISEDFNGAVDKVPLVFHGIILRSQLVTLLDNGVFFNEQDDVSSIALYLFILLLFFVDSHLANLN